MECSEAEFMNEQTVSLRFLGIILRVFRLEVFVCNVYILIRIRILIRVLGSLHWIKDLDPYTTYNYRSLQR
jgi:hypothetical protein